MTRQTYILCPLQKYAIIKLRIICYSKSGGYLGHLKYQNSLAVIIIFIKAKMINLNKIVYMMTLPLKNLKTYAVSTPDGIKVTLPNLNNQTIDIVNALQIFISSLAACETASLRALAKRKRFDLGEITWGRIESNYDLNHWKTEGGPTNKIQAIFLQAQIQTSLNPEELQQIKEMTENLCPIYQVINGSGIKINSVWRLKQVPESKQ